MKKRVFLSLGSNIGDKQKNLEKAIELLIENNNVDLVQTSKIYITDPMYDDDQPNYYNQTIEIKTILNPSELLGLIKVIELKLGRKMSNVRNRPRPIDIDILTVDSLIMDTPGLTLPHPNIQERKFVLRPWSDIAPDFIISRLDKTVTQLLNEIKETSESVILLDEEKLVI